MLFCVDFCRTSTNPETVRMVAMVVVATDDWADSGAASTNNKGSSRRKRVNILVMKVQFAPETESFMGY
jgi:hypothetical protein